MADARFLSATLAWVILVVLMALNLTPASAVRNANPRMPAGKVDPRMLAENVDPCMTDPQTNPACDPFWEDVAVKYSPQYRFHPRETLWPITIDEYLTHVTDSEGFVNGTEHGVVYQAGPITPDNLDTLLENANLNTSHESTVLYSGDMFVNWTMSPWVTDSARNPENGGTKLYTIIYNPKPDDKDSFVEIQYWLFYPYNYASIFHGNHITDLVAIAIRFSKTGQPQRIWYAQNGGGPVWAWDTGNWADPKRANFSTVMGTHPIVYVSDGNHEHFPRVGEFNCKNLCFDLTANGGTVWTPKDNPKSFEFVHVKSEMSASMPNAARAKLFKGRNKWMAFNGKLGGYYAKRPLPFESGLVTGVNAISFQKHQGEFTAALGMLSENVANP